MKKVFSLFFMTTVIIIILCVIISKRNCVIEIGNYKDYNIKEPSVELTQKEFEIEKTYSLLKYSEFKDNVDEIENGNYITIVYSLYDEEKNELYHYNDVETEFVLGLGEFDEYIESRIKGYCIGDTIELIRYDNPKVPDAHWARVYIKDSLIIVFPELSKNFLMQNYNCSSENELDIYLKETAEEIEKGIEIDEIKKSIIEDVVEKTSFNSAFYRRVEKRYNKLIAVYNEYGRLYNMSLEEVLSMYDLDEEKVHKNAFIQEGTWQVSNYIFSKDNIKISHRELKELMEKHAKEYGYNSAREYAKDNGYKGLREDVYEKYLGDYLYKLNVLN